MQCRNNHISQNLGPSQPSIQPSGLNLHLNKDVSPAWLLTYEERHPLKRDVNILVETGISLVLPQVPNRQTRYPHVLRYPL